MLSRSLCRRAGSRGPLVSTWRESCQHPADQQLPGLPSFGPVSSPLELWAGWEDGTHTLCLSLALVFLVGSQGPGAQDSTDVFLPNTELSEACPHEGRSWKG